jgi:hypothetical protein
LDFTAQGKAHTVAGAEPFYCFGFSRFALAFNLKALSLMNPTASFWS